MTRTETYIVCEGYHDRAFWAGALRHLGCADPGERAGELRVPVFDPWGGRVAEGRYGFHTKNKHFVHLVPVGGRSQVWPFARKRLEDRRQKELHRLVICVDADSRADGSADPVGGMKPHDLLRRVQEIDPGAALSDHAEILLTGHPSRVNLVSWHTASNGSGDGLPQKQTLERILCAAMNRAHSDRAQPIEAWLASRPDPPPRDPKEHALSHVAGWFADCGSYEAAIQKWWASPDLSSHLQEELVAGGIWPIMQAIGDT